MATSSQWEWLTEIPLTDPATGDVHIFRLGVGALWGIYKVASLWGREQAYTLLELGAAAVKHPLSEQETTHLRLLLDTIIDDSAVVFQEGRLEDFTIGFTYLLLQKKQITRTDAAEMASSILGRDVHPDTWRRTVDAWAKKRGLEKLDLPQGRPRKRNSANG